MSRTLGALTAEDGQSLVLLGLGTCAASAWSLLADRAGLDAALSIAARALGLHWG